jgi:hypothetical protein
VTELATYTVETLWEDEEFVLSRRVSDDKPFSRKTPGMYRGSRLNQTQPGSPIPGKELFTSGALITGKYSETGCTDPKESKATRVHLTTRTLDALYTYNAATRAQPLGIPGVELP